VAGAADVAGVCGAGGLAAGCAVVVAGFAVDCSSSIAAAIVDTNG